MWAGELVGSKARKYANKRVATGCLMDLGAYRMKEIELRMKDIELEILRERCTSERQPTSTSVIANVIIIPDYNGQTATATVYNTCIF